jgi:hypothetical protein
MNGADREDLKIVIYRLDQQDKFRDELRAEIEHKLAEMRSETKSAHSDTADSLRFIKENLFNPNQGLWAETKKNSAFRSNVTRTFWFVIPASIASVIKLVWDSIRGS